MRILLAFSTAFGVASGGFVAWQAAHGAMSHYQTVAWGENEEQLRPQRIIVGLDISKSNPLIDDPAFAAKVGDKVASMIERMGFASEVHVRTFGSYDAASNSFYFDAVLSTRARPQNVAAQIR